MTKILSEGVRYKLIDYFSGCEVDLLRDMSTRDLFVLARDGMNGYADWCDEDLISRMHEMKRDCFNSLPVEQPTDTRLQALTHLLSIVSDECDKREVQKAIDERIEEFSEGVVLEIIEPDKETKEFNRLYDEMCAEIEIDKILTK